MKKSTKFNIDLNATVSDDTVYGKTALHLACTNGHSDVVGK